MKKILSLLGTLAVTSSTVPIVTINSVVSTTLENNNINLQNFEQLKINRNDFRFITNPQQWGNSFVMRFSHDAVQWLHNNSGRGAAALLGTLAGALGIAAPFTRDNIQTALDVSGGVATVIAGLFAWWSTYPQSLVNIVENNPNTDVGNGIDLNILVRPEPAHFRLSITSAKTWP